MHDYLDFAKSLAMECGTIISQAYYSSSFSYESKNHITDLVSSIDLEVEEKTKQAILNKYQDHKFIAEEAVSRGGSCNLTDLPTWILDPIDGTTNFINKFPYCCYSLALYIHQKAQVGVVFNPILNDLYYAVRGGGAFHNNKPIKVSSISKIQDCLVLSDWGNDRIPTIVSLKTDNLKNLLMHCRGIRSIGSAALHMCFIASGAGEMYFEYGIHCWDIAAAKLIVEEAGGSCSMIDGSPLNIMKRQVLACCNSTLIKEIETLVKHVPYTLDD